MNEYLAIIHMVAFDFAPKGTALCAGQLLSIQQNAPLFTLLGTNYGGDGQTTFGLPDLRGRIPVGAGQGAGLASYTLGQIGGAESHTLQLTEMPPHNHLVPTTISPAARSTAGTTNTPGSNAYAGSGTRRNYSAVNDCLMGPLTATVANTGGNQSFSLVQPYTAINYIIFLTGIFPSRN